MKKTKKNDAHLSIGSADFGRRVTNMRACFSVCISGYTVDERFKIY